MQLSYNTRQASKIAIERQVLNALAKQALNSLAKQALNSLASDSQTEEKNKAEGSTAPYVAVELSALRITHHASSHRHPSRM